MNDWTVIDPNDETTWAPRGKWVLVYTALGKMISIYPEETFIAEKAGTITHWMPLPEPPLTSPEQGD